MKRFSEQFHTKSKSVSLTPTEKQELRERLVSYMEYHPLPAELKLVKKAPAQAPVVHDVFKTVSLPFTLIFKSSAVAAALVLVVPFMAEQSVPGISLCSEGKSMRRCAERPPLMPIKKRRGNTTSESSNS